MADSYFDWTLFADVNVRGHRNKPKMQNSPKTLEIKMSELAVRWKQVSVGDINVYISLKAPIEALGTANQTVAFGQPDSRDEAIVPIVEGERAEDSNGDQNRGAGDDGGDGDMDGTTSSGGVHSKQVNAVLLAVESQRMHYSRRKQTENLPVSSKPPI